MVVLPLRPDIIFDRIMCIMCDLYTQEHPASVADCNPGPDPGHSTPLHNIIKTTQGHQDHPASAADCDPGPALTPGDYTSLHIIIIKTTQGHRSAYNWTLTTDRSV